MFLVQRVMFRVVSTHIRVQFFNFISSSISNHSFKFFSFLRFNSSLFISCSFACGFNAGWNSYTSSSCSHRTNYKFKHNCSNKFIYRLYIHDHLWNPTQTSKAYSSFEIARLNHLRVGSSLASAKLLPLEQRILRPPALQSWGCDRHRRSYDVYVCRNLLMPPKREIYPLEAFASASPWKPATCEGLDKQTTCDRVIHIQSISEYCCSDILPWLSASPQGCACP